MGDNASPRLSSCPSPFFFPFSSFDGRDVGDSILLITTILEWNVRILSNFETLTHILLPMYRPFPTEPVSGPHPPR